MSRFLCARLKNVPLNSHSTEQLMKSNILTVPSSEQVASLESFGEKLREKQATHASSHRSTHGKLVTQGDNNIIMAHTGTKTIACKSYYFQ